MKNLLLALILTVLGYVNINAQTVYVTETGKKYHAKNCNLAKTGKKGIALKQAIKEKYTPCANCKASEIKEEKTEVKKPAKKKK